MDELNLSNVNRLYTVLLLKTAPRHGYELMNQIENLTGKKPSSSHIYPFLSKLEENGFAEASEEDGRKVYHLTEEGENTLRNQIDSFGEILDAVIESDVQECSNCGCEIYSGGYEEDGNLYCCKHCAHSSERHAVHVS